MGIFRKVIKVAPTYKWNDFIQACAQGTETVVVMKDAERDARSDFSLKSKADTLLFIPNGGIDNHDFVRTKP